MPFEYGGQTWPDTTVVTEEYWVTFHPGGSAEGFPRVLHRLCFDSYRNDHELTCNSITNVEPLPGGMVRGKVTALREAQTDTNAYIETTHLRPVPRLTDILSMTPEEMAFHNERLVINSNQLALPTAKPYVVPEPGVTLMLVIGVLGLAVVGWLRRTQ